MLFLHIKLPVMLIKTDFYKNTRVELTLIPHSK